MSEIIKLRKGLNIKLKGIPEMETELLSMPAVVALKPDDFPGLMPKLTVNSGDVVRAGDALFYDKYHPEIIFTAPVGGKVASINRGERRKILEVVIETSKDAGFAEFKKADPTGCTRDEIKENLLKSGLWPFIIKRPYGTLASPDKLPKAIFISTFDTSPLAPDYNFTLKTDLASFQTGVNALAKLTDGKVYLGINEKSIFGQIKNAEITAFAGPHPAGNVGVQVHHLNPVNKGEIVWTVNPQAVVFMGRLFETGKLNLSKTIALTGSEVEKPKYYTTVHCAGISQLTEGKLKKSGLKQRIISGNVLTGKTVTADNYLGFFDNQLSVIPEGDYYEFLGWAMPRLSKYSFSKSYFSWLTPGKSYVADTNLNGEERAFVMTGQYEKVVPMDILPVHLLKAIIAQDIDKMEALGIYEVVEEDFALCEYICTSKIEVQELLRDGINLMIKELGN